MHIFRCNHKLVRVCIQVGCPPGKCAVCGNLVAAFGHEEKLLQIGQWVAAGDEGLVLQITIMFLHIGNILAENIIVRRLQFLVHCFKCPVIVVVRQYPGCLIVAPADMNGDTVPRGTFRDQCCTGIGDLLFF